MSRQLKSRAVAVGAAWGLAAAGAMLAIPGAQARITTINITTTESPTFGGYTFPGVGQYQKLAGTASGTLDPKDSHNSVIVDIGLAQKNAAGLVPYTVSFYILKPINLANGSHKVFLDIPNRGNKVGATINNSSGGNDPGSQTTGLANTFLYPQGYTWISVAWDQAAGTNPANFNSIVGLPTVLNTDGSHITGPSYEYLEFDNSTTTSATLQYNTSTTDTTKATLTVRPLLNSTPVAIPSTGWTFTAPNTIALLPAGTAFAQSSIYELSYTAVDPLAVAVGAAAHRDLISFFRYATKDDAGTPNPMAGDIQRVYGFTESQPARFAHDFVHLGFNQDEQNKKVYDGIENHLGGGDGVNLNYRFGQPTRTERNRQHHLFPEGVFPFSFQTQTDPITGQTDGMLAKCTATSTCPVFMEINSANEYWVKAGSLLHTNPQGTADLADPSNVRYYLLSSTQHGTGSLALGACQQEGNPLNAAPIERALWIAMDKWVTSGTPPPPSAIPTLSAKTMVAPLPQSGVGFPSIPGVTYNGLETTRYLFNWGSQFAQGILANNPPPVSAPYQGNTANGKIYPSFIPTTDADGNDIPGIRLPEVAVPLATYTGWALRSKAFGLNDGCEGSGQTIPFPTTAAARLATGDPRMSVQERYGSLEEFYLQLNHSIEQLILQGLWLSSDTQNTVAADLAAAQAAGLHW